MSEREIIIGIDPGSRHTGIGIILKESNRLKYIYSAVISPAPKASLDTKLEFIFMELNRILEEFKPQTASIEKIFHSVNPRSSLILGHARGVAMLAAKLRGLEIFEYSPNEIKSAVVGAGKADKHQVQAMVRVLLNLQGETALKEDESDALAMAITQAHRTDYSRCYKAGS